MAEASGYTRRGRSRGSGYGHFDGYSRRRNRDEFEILDDGARFTFPPSWKIKSEPALMEKFKNDLKCLGGYSEDADKQFWNDNSVLNFLDTKYLPDSFSKEKKVFLDLTTAEDRAKPYTGTPLQTMHNFFSWVISNDEIFLKEIQKESQNVGKFVCSKSIISRLFRLPYTFKLQFAFHAITVDEFTYLMLDRSSSENFKVYNDQVSKWAHKFEQYLVTGEDTKDGVETNSDFRCVLSSKIGSHKIIYSSSVDCFNPELYDQDLKDLSACVYLKCIHESEESRMKNNLERYKMLAWCGELILTGVPQTLVGFRDLDGTVYRLKLYTPEDLISKGKEYWDLNVCFTFLENLLSFVRNRTASKPGTAFYFKKPEAENCILSSELPVDDFPPQWFLDEIKTMDGDDSE